jgi:hypothetical protein
VGRTFHLSTASRCPFNSLLAQVGFDQLIPPHEVSTHETDDLARRYVLFAKEAKANVDEFVVVFIFLSRHSLGVQMWAQVFVRIFLGIKLVLFAVFQFATDRGNLSGHDAQDVGLHYVKTQH